jgi:hypothetical protein
VDACYARGTFGELGEPDSIRKRKRLSGICNWLKQKQALTGKNKKLPFSRGA